MGADHLRLVDDIVHRLEESILSGQVHTGERLLVVPLAQQYGSSQSTIREALLILERRGLVHTRPRRGASVTRLSQREAFELCQARALLEGYALAAGAERMNDAMLDRMRAHLETMRACVFPRDLPRMIQADLGFHGEIMALCRNDALVDLWANLNGRLGALIMRTVEERQANVDDVVRFHQEVMRALETRDPVDCCREIIRHYLRGFDDALRLQRTLESALTHFG